MRRAAGYMPSHARAVPHDRPYSGAKFIVRQPLLEQYMHNTQRKRGIRSRVERNEPIRPLRCPVAVDINDDHLGTFFACLLGQHHLMHIGADDISTPYNNEVSILCILWTGAALKTHDGCPAFIPGHTANRLVQLA